jgi:uncharacterized protein
MFRVRVYSANAESLYALRAAYLPERQNRHDRHRRLGVIVLSIKKDVMPQNDLDGQQRTRGKKQKPSGTSVESTRIQEPNVKHPLLTLTREQYDKQGMIAAIREQFRISWHGIHGANHWARVLHHGIIIGTERSADLLVIELFAFLHDSQRHSDGGDYYHGRRGAEYARSLNTVYFELSAPRIDALCEAIEHHSGGKVHDHATVQTCWDADRLDLGRVSITPSPKFLSQEAVKHIDAAYRWSREHRNRDNYRELEL